jgi:hypothetical protein
LLQLFELGQNFGGDQLLGRLPDQLMLVGQSLGGKDGFGRIFDEPGAAAGRC